MNKIRIGIIGYGNLGRGVELAINQQTDMELIAVFTRRNPEEIKPYDPLVQIYGIDRVDEFVEKIDVMILCGGSAKDLPEQTPMITKYFSTVDSFDTHAKIPEHFANVDQIAIDNRKVSIISTGWDPGLFSINRVLFDAVLTNSSSFTFWGKGVSQGHSDAVRRIAGVLDAKQYTIPKDEAINLVKKGENPQLSTKDKHRRECFVVVANDADQEAIRKEIITMPNYFDEYETEVHFVSQEELDTNHAGLPHGGSVIHNGITGDHHQHLLEFNLKLDSNPEFTASILTAYARAAFRLEKMEQFGAKTVLDVPVGMLSSKSTEELREQYL